MEHSLKKKNYNFGLVAILIIVVGAIFFSTQNSSGISNIKTQKLASFPDGYYQAMSISGGVVKNIEGLSFSPEGKNVAFVVKQTGKASVYLNDIAGPWYDSVSLSPFAFTPDGKHYMYSATQGKDSFLVVDGKEQEHYKDSIDSSSLIISPLGTTAFSTNLYGGNFPQSYVVFNGHKGKTYRVVSYLKISPDGQNAYYYGCTPDSTNDPYASDLNAGTGFCTFVTQDSNGNTHEADGVSYSSGLDEFFYHGSITFSPDGKLLAYTTRLGNQDSFTINGVKTFSPPGSYEELNISGVVFSPDSKHTAYIVQGCDQNNPCPINTIGQTTGGKFYTVLDNNVMGAEYDEIKSLTFDNNGNLAYLARTGEQWSLVDGTNVSAAPSNFSKFPSQIIFAPNNSYLYTYTDTAGNTDLISNGNQIAQGNSNESFIFPSFTPDGKIIYTTFNSSSQVMSLNIDGINKTKHDLIESFITPPISIYSSPYQFTPNGKVIYGSIDGKNIFINADSI